MRKFIVVRDNKIIAMYACKSSDSITLKEGETLVDVTAENKSYKKGDKFKSLWGRLWGT